MIGIPHSAPRGMSAIRAARIEIESR